MHSPSARIRLLKKCELRASAQHRTSANIMQDWDI